jgi:hypothetical protein
MYFCRDVLARARAGTVTDPVAELSSFDSSLFNRGRQYTDEADEVYTFLYNEAQRVGDPTPEFVIAITEDVEGNLKYLAFNGDAMTTSRGGSNQVYIQIIQDYANENGYVFFQVEGTPYTTHAEWDLYRYFVDYYGFEPEVIGISQPGPPCPTCQGPTRFGGMEYPIPIIFNDGTGYRVWPPGFFG